MAAAGARAVLKRASPRESSFEIALRSDFLWVETASDATAVMTEAVGTASRGRLMVEGAGQIEGLGGVVRRPGLRPAFATTAGTRRRDEGSRRAADSTGSEDR